MPHYKLDQLYASIPSLECQGHCHESCGPIVVGRDEAHRMQAAAKGQTLTVDPDTLTCGYLQDRRCTVYAVRPLICRIWGVVPEMPCPWGCRPSRVLTHPEAAVAFRTLERVAGKPVEAKLVRSRGRADDAPVS